MNSYWIEFTINGELRWTTIKAPSHMVAIGTVRSYIVDMYGDFQLKNWSMLN